MTRFFAVLVTLLIYGSMLTPANGHRYVKPGDWTPFGKNKRLDVRTCAPRRSGKKMYVYFLTKDNLYAGGFMVKFEGSKMKYQIAWCSDDWKDVDDDCKTNGRNTWAIQRTNHGLKVRCGIMGDKPWLHVNLRPDGIKKTCKRTTETPSDYWDREIHKVKISSSDTATISWQTKDCSSGDGGSEFQICDYFGYCQGTRGWKGATFGYDKCRIAVKQTCFQYPA